jgi:hypothetical protein
MLAVAAPLAAQPAAAKREWRWIESENFRLLTDGSERPAKAVLDELERFRASIARLLPRLEQQSSKPTWILLFRDQRGFKPYLPLLDDGSPANWGGYFWRDAQANYIVMPVDGIDQAKRLVYHEYFHYLAANNEALPTWVDEGLAEFYSSFAIHARKRLAEVGKAIPEHLRLLAESSALPLATVLAVDHDSEEYHEQALQGRFYAQSWLLVHWLHYGRVAPPGSFARYLNSPREPGNEGALLERAVGLPLDRIEQELLRYRQRDLLNYMQIALDELPAVAAPTVRPASTAEALARLGELLASQGERRRAEAAQHFAAAGVEMPSAAPAAGTLDPAGPTNRNIVIVERPGPTDELDELRAAWLAAADARAADRFARAVQRVLGTDFLDDELKAEGAAAARVAAEAEPDSLERWRRALALGQAANESSAARIALLEPLVARFPAEFDLRLELAQLELVAGDEQRSAAHARIVLRNAPAGDRTIGPAAAIVAREVTNRALALGEDGRLRQAVELLSETIDGRPPLPEGDALSSLRSTREILLEQLQIAEYNRAVELTRAKKYDAAARVLRTLLDEGAGPTEQNARALLTKIEEYVRLTRG